MKHHEVPAGAVATKKEPPSWLVRELILEGGEGHGMEEEARVVMYVQESFGRCFVDVI